MPRLKLARPEELPWQPADGIDEISDIPQNTQHVTQLLLSDKVAFNSCTVTFYTRQFFSLSLKKINGPKRSCNTTVQGDGPQHCACSLPAVAVEGNYFFCCTTTRCVRWDKTLGQQCSSAHPTSAAWSRSHAFQCHKLNCIATSASRQEAYTQHDSG